MKQRLGLQTALVLVVGLGFWVVALGMVGGLVALGCGIVSYAPEYLFAGLATFALAIGLTLGLVPPFASRTDQDEPTPPLDRDHHPRLHTLVRDVAARVGTPPPEAIYLFHGANAYASARRTRWFGARVSEVGIGLPILASLSCDETRAVVAHEMGHHVAGDVRLGPWVRRTRIAIARAASRLEGSSFWLHLPFVAYADLFLKVSTRVSRAQELDADAVSARVVGATATAGALRKIDRLSAVWDAYFETEVLPILGRGRNPPLLEGFERYREAALTPKTPAWDALEAVKSHAAPRADDTHPALPERLFALGDVPPLSARAESALSLLDDVEREEERVIRALFKNEMQAKITPVSWDAIATEVWLPLWSEIVLRHAKALERLAPIARLAEVVHRSEELAEATREGPAIRSPGAEKRRVVNLLSMWLAVSLAERGFRIDTPPGLAVRAEKGSVNVHPFEIMSALASGEVDAAEWVRRCESLLA